MTKRVDGYFYGTGRRKSSKARVFMKLGSGKLRINTRKFEHYFTSEITRMIVMQPLNKLDVITKFDIKITVRGGGLSGQAGAIRLGIARALLQYYEGSDSSTVVDVRKLLRSDGLLTRDSRRVERKKVGLLKARKKPPLVKR